MMQNDSHHMKAVRRKDGIWKKVAYQTAEGRAEVDTEWTALLGRCGRIWP